jgi:PAS domain S-box-containing protein
MTQENEEKLRLILDSTAEGIYGIDMEGNCTYCNRSFLFMLGYGNPEDLIGKNVHELIHHDHLDGTIYPLEACPIFKAITNRECVHSDDEVFWRADGTNFPVEYWAYPQEKGGFVTGAVVTFFDITERKRMEEDYRKSEERSILLADLLEKSSQPFGLRFLDGRMGIFNDAFCKLTGYSKEELSDFDALQLTPPEWLEREKVFFDELKETGQPVHYEKEYIRKDGSHVPIEVLVHLLRDDAGQPKQYYGFFTDITEKKKMDFKLQESLERFRLSEEKLLITDFAFKSSITPQAIVSLDGIITQVNESFVKTWGYDSEDELIGKPISEIHANPNEFDAIISTIKMNGLWIGEYEARKKDGSSFIVLAQKSSVLDQDGKQIAIYTSDTDITARKNAETELKSTLVNLSRSNRDLEQFAYVASHDLQEPLRMVSSYVKLLERRYKDKLDADADDFINFAVDGSVRMQNLINDLLLFSRVHTRGKEFDISNFEEIFDAATKNLGRQVEDTNATITHDPLPTIMADRVQMVQVLQNLISNGLKFHREEEAPRIHVSAKETDDEWIISVQDNGIGIEAQYYDRLFIIFQRLNEKDKYPGTGIGLAICKRIIERHGGRIWLESEPGIGSTFFFTIPRNLENTPGTSEENLLEQL